jgi:hypothetical protein
MQASVHGTFHFHSTYSHDGRSTLEEVVAGLSARGVSFCIMTEHFEDFDVPKFDRYIQEVQRLNREGTFVLVPGVEVNLAGIDTIVFPVRDYQSIAEWAVDGHDPDQRLFKVLAHPSKYPLGALARHLDTYQVDAIELWNQQADSHYLPPLSLLKWLRDQSWRARYHYFFGCDLHDVTLGVANVIELRPQGEALSCDLIVKKLRTGKFVSRNLTTGIQYGDWDQRSEFGQWADAVLAKPNYRGTLLRGVRTCLKRTYRLLPREAQHSLNDFKNFVRNKI